MAIKRSDPSIGVKADQVFSAMNEKADSRAKEAAELAGQSQENMVTVSFQIKPSDYETLKGVFYQLGLKTGAGIRFALMEFLRNRGAK